MGVGSLLVAALMLLAGCQPHLFDHDLAAASPHPWTTDQFNTHQGDFEFAIIGDHTGMARPGVLERAVSRLNLVQPEFVINVGDLIEGYTEDPVQVRREWNALDAVVGQLQMPFFRVVGNHDMGTAMMRDVWHERYGPDYYSFVYRDVLFIALNSDDPPTPMPEGMRKGWEQAKSLMATDPKAAAAVLGQSMGSMSEAQLRSLAPVNISAAQLEWLRAVVAAHRNVRWTFVFVHKPAWELDPASFQRVEALLADRPYTVFSGHLHNYHHVVRNGHDYIRLGTAGGAIHRPPPGNLDHIVLVAVRQDQPHISNLRLDGILDIDEPEH